MNASRWLVVTIPAVLVLVSLPVGWAAGGGEAWALYRVKRQATRYGIPVSEWIETKFSIQFRTDTMRWATNDYGEWNVLVYSRVKNPDGRCGGIETIWKPVYRWRVTYDLIVANSRSAKDLTPELVPPFWVAAFDDGCLAVPVYSWEWRSLADELAAFDATECPIYQCDLEDSG